MTELQPEPRHRVWRWMQQNEDTAFAIVMAGVAALFIVGIVSAFTYAATDVAISPETPSTVTAGRMPAETTGASGYRPRPPNHDPREDEQMERPR